MEITQTPQFQPITLVLETREEAEALKDAVISFNPELSTQERMIALKTIRDWFNNEAQL